MKKIEMNELDVEQKHSMHVRIISALSMLLVSVPCILSVCLATEMQE